MNWIRSSEGAVLAALLAVSLLAAGTAAAATVSGTAPAPTTEGETVSASATVEQPFRDAPDQWTLQGETDLDSASWTVTVLAQGDRVDTMDFGGENFTYDLDRETGATTVEIEVSGDVPELTTFDYDDRSAENYTALSVARLSDGTANELDSFAAHRFTAAGDDADGSQAARAAIDAAIEANDGKNDKIEQAISSYNNGNFENAVSLAEEAEEGAESSQLLMIGAAVVVLLALVGGGYYYWQSRQDSGYKLQ